MGGPRIYYGVASCSALHFRFAVDPLLFVMKMSAVMSAVSGFECTEFVVHNTGSFAVKVNVSVGDDPLFVSIVMSWSDSMYSDFKTDTSMFIVICKSVEESGIDSSTLISCDPELSTDWLRITPPCSRLIVDLCVMAMFYPYGIVALVAVISGMVVSFRAVNTARIVVCAGVLPSADCDSTQ